MNGGTDCFIEWALSNGYQKGLQIDRKDNDGDYSPDNCQWITKEAQCLNKQTPRYVTYRGETKPLKVWCDELSLDYFVVHSRLTKYGWSVPRSFKEKSKKIDTFKAKCKMHGMNVTTVKHRLERGWSEEDALNIPTKIQKT